MENVEAIFGDKINFCQDQYEALIEADALLIVTEWPVFRTPDFEKIKASLLNPAIFDGRNLYDVEHMDELGFDYFSIGRKEVTHG